MTVRGLDPGATEDVQTLRTELDELLRARRYAAQREQRLTEALEGTADPELHRQLAQIRTLRDGLGARHLELSERLLALEDHRREQTAVPVQRRPTGARFGGAYEASAAPQPAPVVTAAPMRGARFAGVAAPEPAAPQPEQPEQPAQPPRPRAPEPRSAAELAALAARITALHGQGSAQESAAVTAQAAVVLAPADVARLIALLRTEGPAGAAGYLARAVAHGAAGQAAGTLAELRRGGLAEEAAALFHALWGYPAAELPSLLAALEQAGLSADSLTLLWEWGSAPPAELATLADHLRTAGRTEDAYRLLHQAAGRRTDELAATALQLDAQLAAALTQQVARLRSPADLAQYATALTHSPTRYRALLTAVATLDEGRHRAARAALRSVGLPLGP
ncbi:MULTISPECIES: hypothetical protein [unclassified Kitasatospora]|uniref:hypothetical protein n=1 Tax=unclassified Kitasatospora TaxID=2633591 RepID=UPI0007093CF1|nr:MULTISPECIES: hypothetical protein [unclassified Kitasatospora]KQV05532.1 hypothetical protein ASC99_11965 [Kitasatospora sp. Root107]KRB62335.1 hypothetical protein ASE03_06915 [Kitasatospora sp. Root187]